MALFLWFSERPFHFFHIQLPSSLFIHVVRCWGSSVKWNGSSVQGILRDGNHNGILLTCDQSVEKDMNSLRSSFCQDDLVSTWGRYFIVFRNVSCNVLSDWMDAQRVSIASWADNLVKDTLCSVSSVNIDLIIGEKIGVCHTGDDFSEESDGLLMEFLRISNVTEGDRVKWII